MKLINGKNLNDGNFKKIKFFQYNGMLNIINLIMNVKKKMYKNKKLFFIAEAGVNHENNLNLAEKIIKEAKMGGADAVKFQTYKAETIASKYSPAYWDTNEIKINSQFKLFKKYDHFNKNDYQKLKKFVIIIK